MVNIRSLLKNLLSQCLQPAAKFREFWAKKPEAVHCFDMMELIHLLGVIRCKSTNGSVRFFWHVVRFLAGFQFITAFLKMIEQFFFGDNIQLLFWYSLMVLALIVSTLNEILINRYAEQMEKVQNFISSRPIYSQDLPHDSEQRKKFYQFVIRLVKIIVVLMSGEQLMTMIPNAQRDEYCAAPMTWTRFGPLVTSVVEFGFRFPFVFIWLSKYFCCIVISSVLMIGLKTEMRILKRKFTEIDNHVDSLIKRGDFSSRNRIERLRCHASFWNTLDNELSMALEQHLELMQNFYTIRPFMSAAFMCRYYFSLCFIGALLFLAFRIGSVFWFAIIVADVLTCMVEVFCWCYLIDSFQETHESIGEIAFDICTKLPYCTERHLDYVRTRTELIIIGVNSIHGKPMKCGGIFDINMHVFVNLANTVYTVVTFLLNLG